MPGLTTEAYTPAEERRSLATAAGVPAWSARRWIDGMTAQRGVALVDAQDRRADLQCAAHPASSAKGSSASTTLFGEIAEDRPYRRCRGQSASTVA